MRGGVRGVWNVRSGGVRGVLGVRDVSGGGVMYVSCGGMRGVCV